MGRIITNYNDVKKQFPKEVSEIENKIRKGKSKYKNDPFDTFEWAYRWATRIDNAGSLQDLLNGTMQNKQKKWGSMSVEEKVKDVISRSSYGIEAKKGRSCNTSSTSLSRTPKEIEQSYRDQYQKDKDERDKFNSLSPEEQRKEQKKLLDELGKSGGSGFVIGF